VLEAENENAVLMEQIAELFAIVSGIPFQLVCLTLIYSITSYCTRAI